MSEGLTPPDTGEEQTAIVAAIADEDRHAYRKATNPRMAGTCVRCGRPEVHLIHDVKRALVHPDDLERYRDGIPTTLPVYVSTFVPRGKILVYDPSQSPPIGNLDLSS